ncbi:PREDICTED: F-box/LRR-repeat protein At3g59250-like [Camelina sativa]|uniref:F-box/LRR-repeat protein At3g59250-like n=1 Tax=Camelina sativa TaxID=90675 RepID=A0ABM0WF09_CAMSA|nr:PREDICTED: F-box/LRR-repeat protein At3g59250-like [Camelina sativa]
MDGKLSTGKKLNATVKRVAEMEHELDLVLSLLLSSVTTRECGCPSHHVSFGYQDCHSQCPILIYTLVGVDLPSKVFMSESLVRLRIEYQKVDVEHVLLPKLKTLYLRSVLLGKASDYFNKLISGCHVLEELFLIDVYSDDDMLNRSMSSKMLKRLKLYYSIIRNKVLNTVSFDTPNLVYLEYSDYVADKYPKVKFCSLVEVSLNIRMSYGDFDANATEFLMGFNNVQILHLSDNSVEVLTYWCEPIPVFKRLVYLTISTLSHGIWESFPALLKNSPNLETLVFEMLPRVASANCNIQVISNSCVSSSFFPSGLISLQEDIRECVENGQVEVEHVPENEQNVDILTLELRRNKFKEMRDLIGMRVLEEKEFKLKRENVDISLKIV